MAEVTNDLSHHLTTLDSCGGFFSGECFKKHEIDHRFGGQFRIFWVPVVIRNVLEVENVNLKLS